MKTLFKSSIVATFFTLAMGLVSFTPNKMCSERLFHNVPDQFYNKESVDEINVAGNYIEVTWGKVKQYEGGFCNLYIRDEEGYDRLLKNGRNRVSPGTYFLHMDWLYLISADVRVSFECN